MNRPIYLKAIIITFGLTLLTGCINGSPKLGVQHNRLSPCPNSPNCVASHPDTPDKQQIAPILYETEQSLAYEQLLELLQQRKDAIVVKMEHAHYIRADFRSPLLGFIDDVEFYFQIPGVIALRSASRIGYSDLGKNRKRLEELRLTFKQKTTKTAIVPTETKKLPLQTD